MESKERMHVYNRWLPGAVAEETKREKESFSRVVRSVKDSYYSSHEYDPHATLPWISVIDLFIKAKSEICLEDVKELVEFGLQLFFLSHNNLYAQVRWANLLVKLLNKHAKNLSLKLDWRPLYDSLLNTHLTRNTGPEGWRLRQRHFQNLTSLVRSSRKFFPPGAAFHIWSEFRSLLENPWHNSSFDGSGFVRLFLPTNLDNQDFFTHDWVKECIEKWNSIPNCQFWDSQWASIVARCIKNYNHIDWDGFLPVLFTRYLNMFEVPIANSNASFPFSVDVPRNTRFLFSNKAVTPAKAIAKSIVYLLKPRSLAQVYFEKLVNLLEQYYHPSNGGRWTYSLERFLRFLVITFQKRLQNEQLNIDDSRRAEQFLGKAERTSFVEVVLKLINRGQYSKNVSLSETVAAATSILSYVEPSLVLPFIASRFHMALETMTATHQLTTAVMSVAFSGRVLYLAGFSSSFENENPGMSNEFINLLMIALSNALLGMDANDPPKTIASMQLIGSIFSNISEINDKSDEHSVIPAISFSEWLDEFFCRIFSLLQHLEPTSTLNEGIHTSATSGTFLVEDGPYYFCMLEVILGKLSKSLYSQALKKVSKFVKTSILPGAIAEVGLLCCAFVHSNPEEAAAVLVEPILNSIISSLRALPVTGYGGSEIFVESISPKSNPVISPALETSVDYQLKILSVSISYGGPVLLHYKDLLKEAIRKSFEAPSWKINGAGDHLLRSLLGSLVLYYPSDQYKCVSCHPDAPLVEEWISTKYSSSEEPLSCPKWHIPNEHELSFANELFNHHFCTSLDTLLRMCRTKVHSDPGNEKEHLKVTLLRIDSSLQGVLSCLPDFHPPVANNRGLEDIAQNSFFIAGASGSVVGNSEMREKAAEIIHVACKYLLEERSDQSILLLLIIRIIDALGNFGSLEYDEWSNHRQAWRLESSSIIEPPINFVVRTHFQGKKRPRWALIDKAYMHNTWRSSQSSYHLFRTRGNISPPEHVTLLMDDLLTLSLHSYETVRLLAGKSLLKMLKRWPSMISRCVLTLAENLHSSDSAEHTVLGSCAILSTQTVIKCLTLDMRTFASFLLGILASSHHESLKCQKAINELFIKYNIHFAGVSRSTFRTSDGPEFMDLVSQIRSMSVDSNGLHWRYNLMANRVLLLLAMASRSSIDSSSKILSEAAGHFLKNLKSQLPQTRILSVSALNTLLRESSYKISPQEQHNIHGDIKENPKTSFEATLSQIYEEEQFFHDTLTGLSHVHVVTDTESASSGGNGASSFQSLADKSITRFYFEFSSSWPRTPSWISLLGNDTFYSNFARIFKRLVQECGIPVLLLLKSSLEEFSNAKERSKQCVAAEALAGVMHSDVNGLFGAWDSWISIQLQNIIQAPLVESLPEWAACIRYAVTGKGKYGKKVPLLRQRILDCLVTPLPQTVATNVVAKRYAFISAALLEISAPRMPLLEVQTHDKLLEELLDNMHHTSAQVREAIGITLSVLCSNIRLYESFTSEISVKGIRCNVDDTLGRGRWVHSLTDEACEVSQIIQDTSYVDNSETRADETLEHGFSVKEMQCVKRMETMFHFIISSLKSGRSQYLLDIIVDLLHPVIALRETSHKDMSTLAKAAFELLKWRIFPEPHLQKAVSVLLSLSDESNWRTRFSTLTYLRTFVHRHMFVLSRKEKQKIWNTMEKLLVDNQVEVREHAAAVLAGLMKGGDEETSKDYRDRAFTEALSVQKKRMKSRGSGSGESIASIHGAVLALAASVLSVPYDMPSWLPAHVTLLARFIGEPSPVRSTVMKAVAEFRRTHADTWILQKDLFTNEQLEVLADTCSSASYFA